MKFTITRATSDDIKQLYDLQLIAFESEAQMIGNRSVPALMETPEQARKEFYQWQVLKAVDSTGKIIGSVRYKIIENTVDIGRLMVDPEHRGNGLGMTLLYEVEKYVPDMEYELFTCTKSISNIRLYERLGYKPFKEEKSSDGLDFVYMKKNSDSILIQTDRLSIHPGTDDEMKAFINKLDIDVLKQAYTEMFNGSITHPDQRIWYAIWMIELKDGTHIGELCFKGIDPDGSVEIGYGISSEYEGNGYATEAVTAVVRWADNQKKVSCIQAETESDNIASQKVLLKSGFVKTGFSGEEGPRFIWNRT